MSNAFWHGFADMHAIEKNGPVVIERGEGSWIWDVDGNKYFDAAGALWYVNVGHGRRRIADLAAKHPRVVASAPYVNSQGLLTSGNQVRGAFLRGIVPELEEKVDDLARSVRSGPRPWRARIGSARSRRMRPVRASATNRSPDAVTATPPPGPGSTSTDGFSPALSTPTRPQRCGPGSTT